MTSIIEMIRASEEDSIKRAIADNPDENPLLLELEYAGSYTRMRALLKVRHANLMNDDEWFRRLGELWSQCDDIASHRTALEQELQRASRARLDLMMDENEKATLAALPNTLTVYRGCYGFNREGLSWTLSADIARWFVTGGNPRYCHRNFEPLLLTGCVSKATCVLKLNRDEQEIIATRVRVIDSCPIDARYCVARPIPAPIPLDACRGG